MPISVGPKWHLAFYDLAYSLTGSIRQWLNMQKRQAVKLSCKKGFIYWGLTPPVSTGHTLHTLVWDNTVFHYYVIVPSSDDFWLHNKFKFLHASVYCTCDGRCEFLSIVEILSDYIYRSTIVPSYQLNGINLLESNCRWIFHCAFVVFH